MAERLADGESDSEQELNRMISNIGFGRYHRRVLALCGLGWTADNAWMQCTACILPRVQRHFGISNGRIGLLSSCMFLGLMCGALVWGPVSDRFGRLVPYRWTLVVSATFGLLASAAPSFPLLCVCLFGLGSGVGGNMPVDGAIFLEFVPREKRHLLTMLSVFFSAGSVLTSAVALALLPPFSCPDEGPCDVGKQNNGWRYLLVTVSLLTIAMVVLRNGWFRLYETPKFLLQNRGRSDVVVVLKKIATFNGAKAQAAPEDARSPLAHIKLVRPLFAPGLRRTTSLVWAIWGIVAMGFTMFNVFLPKLLEATPGSSSQVSVYRDALIYAVSGVPGSLLGAWLVDTRLGRIYSMTIATAVSGLALIGFAFSTKAHIPALTIVASSVFGLTSTLMFAVIYAYTPEVFRPAVRGTACGTASAIGRVAGILAPLITGLLLELNSTIPLYVSVALLWAAAVCMFMLPIETRDIAA
ncbi:major facilitator superfamily domain-containing protein [Coemansia mojavensis]|nr:major facilitator superfamily domain-containing protein [Coemansia mojavensis]